MHVSDEYDPFNCLEAARLRSELRAREDAAIAALLDELDREQIASGEIPAPHRVVTPELPVPVADVAQRAGRGARQVGFRLGPRSYADLQEAAEMYDVRPATLARMLTARGVQAALVQKRNEAQ